MHTFRSKLIGTFYQYLLKPVLFKRDPEEVHDQFISIGSKLGNFAASKSLTKKLFHYQDKSLKQKINGLTFQNPIGLSAGFDKDANLVNILEDVGFGFTQVGTVTNRKYEGNPKPRLTRLPKSKGLVVYYGLKNIGIDKISQKLKGKKIYKYPISISIGKTNCVETAKTKDGIEDYYQCFKKAVNADIGNFYTINISCPNTFGGEPFTTPQKLDLLLAKLKKVKTKKPILIKMPINHTWRQFDNLLKVILKHKIDGVIIGNLNKKAVPKHLKGGVSGKPTWDLSNDLISKTYKKHGDKLIIIGVGGVFSARDAYEKIKKGASLVQLITGMVYQGPQLIGEINYGISKRLQEDNFKNIQEAVGKHHSKPKIW